LKSTVSLRELFTAGVSVLLTIAIVTSPYVFRNESFIVILRTSYISETHDT